MQTNKGIAVFGIITMLVLVTTLLIVGLTIPVARDTTTLTFLEGSKEGRFLTQGMAEHYVYQMRTGVPCSVSTSTSITTQYYTSSSTISSCTGTTTSIVATADVKNIWPQMTIQISPRGVPHTFAYAVQTDDGLLSLADSSTIVGEVYANNLITAAGNAQIQGSTTSATKYATSTTKTPRYGSIAGDAALAFDIGTSSIHGAYAPSVSNTSVTGNIYCIATTSSANNKSCTSPSTYIQPYTKPLPYYPNYIQTLKQYIASYGRQLTGPISISGSTTSYYGPTRINGNLSIVSNGIMRLNNIVWVTGDLSMQTGGRIISTSTTPVMVFVEGEITLTGSSTIAASPSATSTAGIALFSTSRCPYAGGCGGQQAITISGNSMLDGIIAPQGTVVATSGAPTFNFIMASSTILGGNALVTYDPVFRSMVLPTVATSASAAVFKSLLPITGIDFR